MNSKIVLAEQDERYANSLRAVIEDDLLSEVLWVNTTAQALAMARRGEVHLVILGPSIPWDVALQFDKDLSVYAAHVSAVYIAPQVTTELMRGAIKSGIVDILSAAEQPKSEIAIAVRIAAEEALQRFQSAVDEVDRSDGLAKVISVLSTKGGVGKSFIASNLAIAVADAQSKSVIVLDLDFEAGDLGIMFNLKPSQTIIDAVQVGTRLEPDLLGGMLSSYNSGVRVLLAPARPEDAEMVSVAKVIQVIGILREMCDVLIIDCPSGLNQGVLSAVQMSDAVMVVVAMEMTSVKSTRVAIQKLRALGYSDEMMHLIINRSGSKVFLEAKDIEKALGLKAYAHIPSDRLVPRSVNMGVPLVVDNPKSSVAKSVFDLAERLMTDMDKQQAAHA